MRRRDSIECASDEIGDLEACVRTLAAELRLTLTNPHGSAEHAFSDLEPLRELRALEVLEVSRSRVADLSRLASLRELRRLDLSRTRVADLGPLGGLGKLASLGLAGTPVSDLSAAERAGGARGAQPVGDRGGVARAAAQADAAARAGRARHARARPVAGGGAAGAARGDTRLDVSGSRLTSFAGLEDAHQLRSLQAIGTPVEDLSEWSGCTGSRCCGSTARRCAT